MHHHLDKTRSIWPDTDRRVAVYAALARREGRQIDHPGPRVLHRLPRRGADGRTGAFLRIDRARMA
ncbi:MAG: hypothetical protein AAF577_06470 [Pseudomonadota bacterium]